MGDIEITPLKLERIGWLDEGINVWKIFAFDKTEFARPLV
jgi:hypothetical protein